MDVFLNFISNNPILFTIIFALSNLIWAIFTVFLKQKNDKSLIAEKAKFDQSLMIAKFAQDKELENIKQNFQMEFEKKKKKNFGIKQEAYEKFFKHLDSFSQNSQIEYQNKMNNIMTTYLSSFLKASQNQSVELMTQSINRLGQDMQTICIDMSKELNVLNNETNLLRLVAPENIRIKLSEMEYSYRLIFERSSTYITKLSTPEFILNNENNQNLTNSFKQDIQPLNNTLMNQRKILEDLIRMDLFS